MVFFAKFFLIYTDLINGKKKYHISVRFSVLSFLYSPLRKSKVLNWSVEPESCGNENREYLEVLVNIVNRLFKNSLCIYLDLENVWEKQRKEKSNKNFNKNKRLCH